MDESVNEKKSFKYSTEFQIATQLKSWMAINIGFGCIWDCVYCIQHKDKFFAESNYKTFNKKHSPEEAVGEIMASPRITSKTPLTFYNFSDPFLPQNTSDLIKMLLELDKRKFKNIVGLITRTFADSDTLDAIANLNNIKPIILVSYTGYENKLIESGPLSMRIKLAEELKKRNVPVLQYLRPIVREWLEKDQFKKARDSLGNLIKGVVMSGIRVTPEIKKRIIDKGLPVPNVPNYTNKFFPKDIQEEILEVYKDVVPVYRYTSCGISAILKIPDYNAHLGFFRETQNKLFAECPLPCREGQSKICGSCSPHEKAKIKDLLGRICQKDVGFDIISSGAVYLDKEIPKEDLTFLRHNTSCHVDYARNKHHIDQVVNIEIESTK